MIGLLAKFQNVAYTAVSLVCHVLTALFLRAFTENWPGIGQYFVLLVKKVLAFRISGQFSHQVVYLASEHSWPLTRPAFPFRAPNNYCSMLKSGLTTPCCLLFPSITKREVSKLRVFSYKLSISSRYHAVNFV